MAGLGLRVASGPDDALAAVPVLGRDVQARCTSNLDRIVLMGGPEMIANALTNAIHGSVCGVGSYHPGAACAFAAVGTPSSDVYGHPFTFLGSGNAVMCFSVVAVCSPELNAMEHLQRNEAAVDIPQGVRHCDRDRSPQ